MSKLYIFIHGIGSSSDTWEDFIDVALHDDGISDSLELYEPEVTSISKNKNYLYLYDYESSITQFKRKRLQKIIEGITGKKTIGSISIDAHTRRLKTSIGLEEGHFDEIIIIAHSMGGIIALKLLLYDISNDNSAMSSCILYGSPIYGSEDPKLIEKLFPNIPSEILNELHPDSLTIDSLKQKINANAEKLKEKYNITCVFGDADSRIILPDEGFINSFASYETVKGGHSEINKPQSLTVDSFRVFKRLFLAKNKIANKIYNDKKPVVVSVGGANLEYIYKQNDESKFLIKQSYHQRETEYGGSGLNYFLRLTAAGVNVLPIIPIGSDKSGNDIVNKMNTERAKVGLSIYDSNLIINQEIDTIESLIVSDKKGRTIWSQSSHKLTSEIFNQYIDRHLSSIEAPKYLMIGHIHSDKTPDMGTLSTYKLLSKYEKEKTIIYVNLGKTQLKHGYDFWKETLKKADILQFNIEEVKYFFRGEKGNEISLNNIIEKLRELNSIILITMDQLGAICIAEENEFYAYQINIDGEYKDKTGAGDAFASGIIYDLLNKHPNLSSNNISDAMRGAVKTGRIWATYACTKLGGASECPTVRDLELFEKKLSQNNRIRPIKDLDELTIDLIDRAYSKC